MIVLFDGYCVMCSGFARLLRKRMGASIQLLAMQSAEGAEWLARLGFGSQTADEVVVITPAESVIAGPEAILFLLKEAGGVWRFWARVLRVFPDRLTRWGYRIVAKNRYRWFGKRDSCAIV